MTEPQSTQVGIFVEHQLDQLAAVIGKKLSADVMAIYGPIYPGADTRVRQAIEAHKGKRRSKLAVVLDTGGGVIEVVERMVNTIRHHYPEEVVVIVPDRAMSAGTVFAMSGDAIMMDYYSCLGPIDPQVETGDGKLLPALSYLKQYDRLKEKEPGKLTDAEVILLQKLDLAELHSFEEARALSDTLLQEWLAKYKFKEWKKTETRGVEVTEEMRKERALAIAQQLADCEKWHSHGRPISMATLTNDLKLKIADFASDDIGLKGPVTEYHEFLKDYMAKIAAFHFVHAKGICLFYTL
jgi:membrane-bound ClpP family serine protease